MIYQVQLLKDVTRPNYLQALSRLRERMTLTDQPGIFGLFGGLFGLASNELYLVSYEPSVHDITPLLTDTGFEIQATTTLTPTVRPLNHEPRTVPGIYVFRWFTVKAENVQEIIRLSNQAWTSFEGGFDTEVQALFAADAARATDASTTMLLITRYRDLSVWQDSRSPAPEARENFLKRSALTIEAKPIATTLLL
ncbi:MAG: hypothetical protein KDI36_07335 [Pseudomonadales bacterium]|nr:hypothetical protein [Pseudomonadales bacterium]